MHSSCIIHSYFNGQRFSLQMLRCRARALPHCTANASNRPFYSMDGAHAQRESLGRLYCLSVCECVSICYSTSHFSSVCSSHKGYDLSEISNGFL